MSRKVSPLYQKLAPLAERLHRFSTRLLKKSRPEWDNRRWSNAELRRFSRHFSGDVINVSGWHDQDKEGGLYRDYFPHRRSYTISNIGGARGTSGHENEIFLDLTGDLQRDLHGKFDVVFNHTVLEHIYEIDAAVRTLCTLSRDLVVVVVPFSQQVHFEAGSFLDYWRPTPFSLASMFGENGFRVLYCTRNENPVYPIYTYCIATAHPDKWAGVFPESEGLALIHRGGVK